MPRAHARHDKADCMVWKPGLSRYPGFFIRIREPWVDLVLSCGRSPVCGRYWRMGSLLGLHDATFVRGGEERWTSSLRKFDPAQEIHEDARD